MSDPRKFRKKPVVIEAVQWTGENFDALREWGAPVTYLPASNRPGLGHALIIGTLEDGPNCEAVHIADPLDWIICGVKGEFYPCKPDIFAATYEPVGAVAAGAGDRPPAPSEAAIAAAANVMRDAAFCSVHAAAWRGEATDATQWRVRAGALNCDDCNTLALRCALDKLGAVRPPPRAALTVERLAALLWKMANEGPGVGSHIEMAEWLLPRLGAASPAAAPPEEP